MRSYLLIVLLLSPLPTTPQFSTCDIRGTTPTLPCNYCTLSPSITIGANATLPPTPQTLSVGLYSTTLALGTFSPSTTMATGATAGPIAVGISSPTSPAPTQVVTIADYSATLRLGRFANSIIMGISPTAPSIIIGATTPTPTPSTIQNINICPWCSTLSLGSGNTGGVSVATGPTAGPVTIGAPTGNPTQVVSVGVGTVVRISNTNTPGGVVVGNEIPSPSPTFVQDGVYSRYGRNVYLADGAQSLAVSYLSTAGPVTIGSPTANPGQGVVIAQASASLSIAENLVGDLAIALGTTPNIYLGRHFKGSASQNINIGEVFVTPTPTPSGQTINMGLYSGAVNVATGPTAGPVTIGRTVPAGAPSLSGSNQVNLLGLYHYFYTGVCRGNAATSTAKLTCDYSYSTNANVNTPVTSGYDTATDFWYPPEPGHYMVTANAASEPSSYGYLYILARVGGVTSTFATARAYGSVDLLSISASVIISFNTVGTDNYIYLEGADLYDTSFSEPYTRLIITRVA